MADPDARKARLGQQVQRLRVARGLSQKALAERAQLSARFVTEVEKGRANPSLGSLQELADGLAVPLLALLLPWAEAGDAEALERFCGLSRPEAEPVLAPLRQAQERAVVLLGLRGAGKSTVGPALASALGRRFVELDRLVEEQAGMRLSSIFEIHGEVHYRELERSVLRALLDEDPRVVVAVSGGIVTDDDALALLRGRTQTVWLKAPPQAHWDRVVAQGDERPMDGRSEAREELEQLYWRRAPLYGLADVVVETMGRDMPAVVDEVQARLAR